MYYSPFIPLNDEETDLQVNVESVYYSKNFDAKVEFEYSIKFEVIMKCVNKQGIVARSHFEIRNGKMRHLYGGMVFENGDIDNKDLALQIKNLAYSKAAVIMKEQMDQASNTILEFQ